MDPHRSNLSCAREYDTAFPSPAEIAAFNRIKAWLFILFAATAFLPSEAFAERSIDYSALGNEVAVIGKLGVPLGTAIEIDATVVAGRSLDSKGWGAAYLLKVTKVGSNPTADALICEFRNYSWSDKLASDTFSLYKLKKGKETGRLSDAEIEELERGYVGQHFHLLVYEEGSFSGIPRNLPKGAPTWQDRGFGFRTRLIVLRDTGDAEKSNQTGRTEPAPPAIVR